MCVDGALVGRAKETPITVNGTDRYSALPRIPSDETEATGANDSCFKDAAPRGFAKF